MPVTIAKLQHLKLHFLRFIFLVDVSFSSISASVIRQATDPILSNSDVSIQPNPVSRCLMQRIKAIKKKKKFHLV